MLEVIDMATSFIFALWLGGFRGGEVLETGHTFETRSLWSVGVSLLVIVTWMDNNVINWGAAVLPVVLYLTMDFISHGPYQNMASTKDYIGMFFVGAARGLAIGLALCYWIHSAIWLIPMHAIAQVSAYAIGKYLPINFKNHWVYLASGTPTAEDLQSGFLYVILAILPQLPSVWFN